MKNELFIILISALYFIPVSSLAYAQEKAKPNPLIQFLKDIEYSSRLKFEHESNIFFRENDEDSDYKEVFTQTMTYRRPMDDHYFQWGYRGNYAYYSKEGKGVLGHSANVLYSYRPFNGFSIGIRDDYNWLQDSTIGTAVSDRVLSLGYVQNNPTVQLKYAFCPRGTVSVDTYYQFLDVKDKDNDDYIDNKRFGAKGQLNYDVLPEKGIEAYAGAEHKQIAFPQIFEKSSVSFRPFIGLIKKFANLLNITTEVGFENIDMDDNSDDDNVDVRASIETVFSVFTKLRLTFAGSVKRASLREEYTQYGSTAASFEVNHAIDPKTSITLNYGYEKQDFDSGDALAGQSSIDRKTEIHRGKINLSRKIKKWLSWDFNYDYTQRDTDFAKESYTNHLFSVGVTAKY